MPYLSLYKSKLKTPEEAVKAVKNGDWVDYGFGLNMPELLDRALAARRDELEDVKIRGILAFKPLAVVEQDPEGKTFCYNSWHMGGHERGWHDKGLCSYIPMLYRNKPGLYRDVVQVDVACITVSPMDSHGYFSFSFSNSASRAIVEKAETVIVEVNERHPRVLGGADECVHISDVDIIVEGTHEELFHLPEAAMTDVDQKTASFVVEQIENGSTIQLGIGGMPNAVGKAIADSDLKDLGMHTEMLVDSYLDMYLAGKLTNKMKNIDRGKGVWSICAGSPRLYEWIAENPGLASYPVEYTNDPWTMSKNDKLITINNCIEVDLYGQVCSESAGMRNISGTGGQLDFLTGGYMSKGGKSFICLTSTYKDKKTGELKSRIVPTLPQGGIVTDPRSQVCHIVTEYGTVFLAGLATWQRAEALISIAHPQLRDTLVEEAEKMNIWRRSNKRA